MLKHRNHAPKRYLNEYERGRNDAIDSVADHYLLDVPSAEPKRGKWRHYERVLCCSVCLSEIHDDVMELLGDEVPKFCPNCGARMESGIE